jgi:ABC-2 type transport system permease protein
VGSGGIVLMLRRAFAFLWRDAADQLSYPFALFLELSSVGVVSAMFYFLGQWVDRGGTRLGSSYFAFALTGIALASFLSLGVSAFSSQLRQAQLTGTLEALFMTPAHSAEIVLWGSLWRFTYEALKICLYLGCGALLGVGFHHANWPAAVVVLALSILALAPLGVFGAAFVLVYKRGDPIAPLLGTLSTLFAGVYYPVDVLPGWLEPVSVALPLTHAVRAFRGAVLEGQGFSQLFTPLAALFAFAAVLGPVALIAFSLAVSRAKARGTLSAY